MRTFFVRASITLFTFAVALSGAPASGSVSTVVGPQDDRVTRHTYVRHDGGTDATIEICNSTDPEDYGNNTVNNEPFSVVDPNNPLLVVSGWNDYCSDWMGLGFSNDGGQTWTNSLVRPLPLPEVRLLAPEIRGRP